MKKLSIGVMFVLAITVLIGNISIAGTISGTVTSQDSSLAINRAMVKAYGVNGPFWPVAMTWTDSSGNYELDVAVGDYHVKASAYNYLCEWWQEVPIRDDATIVTVSEGNNPTGINFTLTPQSSDLGSIAGTVTDFNTTSPIENAVVTLRKAGSFFFNRTVQTSADGSYLFDDLPSANYHVKCQKDGYLPQDYVDPVTVNGNDVTDIDFALVPLVYGSIAGTVTDSTTGLPIEGARVRACLPGYNHYGETALTGVDGTYLIDSLVPGDYNVSCREYGYETAVYPTPVTVNGDDITGIDFQLVALVYGGISGIVTDSITNAPIQGALIIAIKTTPPYQFRLDVTDETGAYDMTLLSGEYHVEARKWGYFPKSVNDLVVVGDSIVTGVDFALVPVAFGSISGTVYDSDSVAIADAMVVAHKIHGFGGAYERTDSLGDYTLDHLFPGDYRVKAFAASYIPDVYDQPVVVENGSAVTGIDFYLTTFDTTCSGIISGTVTDDSTAAPIADATLVAFGRGMNPFHTVRRFTHSNNDGTYTFDNLPLVNYRVLCIADDYRSEFYDDQTYWCNADLVTPDASGVDFGLTAVSGGGRYLSGQIVENRVPVSGAVVIAKLGDEVVATTASYPDGYYYFKNLVPGSYNIEVISPTLEEKVLEDVPLMFADIYDADVTMGVTSVDEEVSLPMTTALHQNYPNPFNASTCISFDLVNAGDVELSIYDLLGREVTTLHSSFTEAGSHSFTWNGINSNNETVVSGMYLYILKIEDKTLSKRMMLLK